MGWPPAVVIVVRHGARLDAADKQWHLTSPTPYDPPLTYSGWTQSRALGARIASILRSRETDDDLPVPEGGEEQTDGSKRKRRHKVIIHTSPFLRCVQTSVAISAGLAQNPGHIHRRVSASASPHLKPSQMHSSPKTRPTLLTGSPALAPVPEPVSALTKVNGKPKEQPLNIKKSTIRVDAFLGEWLSPDYFELITPPPSSIMMVAGAKADLLRREDYSNLVNTPTSAASNQGFPGGWGSPVILAEKEKEKDDTPLSGLSSLAQALPRRDRTSSLSSVGSNGSRVSGKGHAALAIPAEHGVYQIPVPNYAISSSDPIPPGYVAHARDSCVDVDYQWDSMREPQNWGNGGEYGEEWSSMHKRFRKGLQNLVGWYQNSDDPGKVLTRVPSSLGQTGIVVEENPEDEDTDLVIILVTHGAGCNALIGALTNQPVLLDVGMASLTMAVRKPTPPNSPHSSPNHSRTNLRNTSISDQYDVKLVANTEHLRSSSGTPTTSRAPSATGLLTFRERFSNGNSFSGPTFRDNTARSATMTPNFGSIRRTASVASSSSSGPRSYVPTRQSSIGLWSAPQSQTEETEEEPDDMILNFGNDGAIDARIKFEEKIQAEAAKEEGERDEEDDVGPLGLWGSPRPPGFAEKNREIAPKRRWTVNERGEMR